MFDNIEWVNNTDRGQGTHLLSDVQAVLDGGDIPVALLLPDHINNNSALGLLSRDWDLLGYRPGHGVTLLHRTDGAHILHCVYFPQWHLSFVLCSFQTPWIITNIINTVKTRYCLTTLSLPSVCSSSKGNTGNSVSLNLGGVDNTDKGMFPWYSTLQTLWKKWSRLSCSFKLCFAPLLNRMTVKRLGLNARIFAFEPF